MPEHVRWPKKKHVMARRNRRPEIVTVRNRFDIGTVDPELKPLLRAKTGSPPNNQVTCTLVARRSEAGGEAESEAKGKGEELPRPDHPEI